MSKKKDKVKGAFNYFKVSDKLLDTEIKKSELWVYLTHCRTSNIKKSKETEKYIRYSLSGITKVKELFGNKASETMYNKAMTSLIEKGLLREIDIKKHGINKKFYKKKKAIEIIESDRSIQIPIILLEEKLINNMKKEEIITAIKLYNNYNPAEFGSIDKDYIKAYNNSNSKGYRSIGVTFGEGFNRSIYKKSAYEVMNFNTVETMDKDLDIETINKLVEKGLFSFKPLVMYVDEEDEDIKEIKYELFKGLVSFKSYNSNSDYIFTGIEENHIVIWVLEPLHSPYIEPYINYVRERDKAYTRALFIYSDSDDLTIKKHSRYALYDSVVYDYLEELELLDNETMEKISDLRFELEGYTYQDGSLSLFYLQEEMKSLKEQIKKVEEVIDQENENIKLETGRKGRKTTNDELKAIEKRIGSLDLSIFFIEDKEEQLLNLLPLQAIEQFFYNAGYEIESVGRARRFICDSF